MKSLEVQLNESIALVATRDAEIVSLKEAVTNHKKAAAKAERDSQLKESKLPEPCVKRIGEAFKESTDNAGLKEAINVEAEYVKSLGGPVQKKNGASEVVTESAQKLNAARERQFNTYRKSGMSIEAASSASGFTPSK